jgi:integrase
MERVMARPMGLLTVKAVEKQAKEKGIACDGGGLYLRSDPPSQCSWLFRYRLNGKARWMGLGPYPTISLAEAREKAAEQRRLKASDKDPIEERQGQRRAARIEVSKRVTFAKCAADYIATHKAGWKNPKHASQWTNTLTAYAYPIIGTLPVREIDNDLMCKVLEPIWTTKTETAKRVRARVEAILDYATVKKYRDGANPARWKGNLEKLLPKPAEIQVVEHHPALPYVELPNFMTALRDQSGTSARAFEFLILTSSRTNEVIGAKWKEVDLDNSLWVVPKERLKTGKKRNADHRVPLSGRAVEILRDIKPENVDGDAYVFPGTKADKPLSNMAFLMLLRRMSRTDLTAHGFRSTFKDWGHERTNFATEVIEMALAHTVGDKVEQAYRRGDLFDKRRQLSELWSEYCAGQSQAPTANVVPIREAVS